MNPAAPSVWGTDVKWPLADFTKSPMIEGKGLPIGEQRMHNSSDVGVLWIEAEFSVGAED
ncbi:MAG: hypothetical protein ACWGQW_05820 [bacterium]